MHTSPLESFSDLIAGIYDAALDPSRWYDVLARTARFAGGATAGILSKDAVSRRGDVHHSYGVEASYLQSYRDTYWRFDPLTPVLLSEIGEISARDDFVADDEFLEGRFYREWVQPQGWIDAANVVLDRQGESFALFSMIRSGAQGKVDEEMRSRLGVLVPHLRRAALIGRIVERAERRSCALGDLIDTLSSGVFLLDGEGGVVHANHAGQQMIAAHDPVRVEAQRLTTISRGAAAELAAAIEAATRGDVAMGLLGVASPVPARDGSIYVAHVLPMGTRGGLGAAVAVFIQRAMLDVPAVPKVIADTYALTPAELRVLLQVVESSGVAETARALGVRDATVKTHLNRVFGKTGVSRQADLVRLVAGFSASLAHRRTS